MLYCPKCQQNYEEGVQRFCPNDNARLLTAPSADKSARQKGIVFSSIINQGISEEANKFASVPKFSQVKPTTFSRLNFRPPTENVTKDEAGFKPELELEPSPAAEKESSILETSDSPVDSSKFTFESSPDFEKEAASETPIFDSHNPASQIGQIIQERYLLQELIKEDEDFFSYLAEDKTDNERKVIVKIFVRDNLADSFADKIFAEERLALRQLNHPNIARIVDSGELSDGTAFLVTECVQGSTIKEYLKRNGQFNALRAARIIRQSADALGAAHKIGVPHRALKTEKIILTVDENGIERIKLTGFGTSKEKLNEANLLYKSPEQVEGKVANFTSDEYSLAVVAYQLLTNRLPFDASSVGDLLREQREGFKVQVSEVRDDLPASIDEVLKKALAFNPFDRYEKVQDFGDEFFGEIIAHAPLETDEETSEPIVEEVVQTGSAPVLSAVETKKITLTPIEAYEPPIREKKSFDSGVKATNDLAWEKRSPEPPNEPNASRSLLAILGVAAVLIALISVWYYFINRPGEQFVSVPAETANVTEPNINAPANIEPTPEEIESPPIARAIQPPPDSFYFQNGKENLKGDLLKNFLGFSLYYPKDWQRNDAPNNFLDVSKKAPNGLPIEQMLVTYYNSKGTYKADTEIFPAQVKETNESLKKILPNYQMISEGKKTLNNGWQAYEVQFQGTGKVGGEEITIWGKRLFVPTAIRGMKNGYVITMLATSLSKDVKNVGDVGEKGELSSVLETFEPNQTF